MSLYMVSRAQPLNVQPVLWCVPQMVMRLCGFRSALAARLRVHAAHQHGVVHSAMGGDLLAVRVPVSLLGGAMAGKPFRRPPVSVAGRCKPFGVTFAVSLLRCSVSCHEEIIS